MLKVLLVFATSNAAYMFSYLIFRKTDDRFTLLHCKADRQGNTEMLYGRKY